MAGIREIAEKAGVDAGLVERFLKAMVTAIKDGERVTLRGLGSFRTKVRSARTVKTALMMHAVEKPEHRVVIFKPSQLLKNRISVDGD